ncbi:MAG TPA: SDR family oxidoreductase [Polyangiaceae bacterium]|jgi:short-subunit dehydrogenase
MKIFGSVFIVTGASSGIGAATVRELAGRGGTVVMAARRSNLLDPIAEELTQKARQVLAVPTDVRNRQSIDELVAKTVAAYGRVDGVINAAGIVGAGVVGQATDEILEQLVLTNLLAPARLIHAALPFMRHDGSAAIVNIGSVAGEMGTNGMYSATKFGLRGLNDSLRRELRTKRIAVSLIEPGWIRTAMTTHINYRIPGPELIADAVARVLERPKRSLILPWQWRPLVRGVQLFPGIADAVFGSQRGQAKVHRRRVDAAASAQDLVDSSEHS